MKKYSLAFLGTKHKLKEENIFKNNNPEVCDLVLKLFIFHLTDGSILV